MKFIFCYIILFTTFFTYAQRENHADFLIGFGKETSSFSGQIVRNFKLFKSEKIHVGPGVRASYIFSTQNATTYTTAPAKHTKTNGGIDTLIVNKPMFINLNLSFNISYHHNAHFSAGFSADLVGLSFGKKKYADFYPGAASQAEVPARTVLNDKKVAPMNNNLRLTGDRNKGSLIAQLYVCYSPGDRYRFTGGYNFVVMEYKSSDRIGHSNNYRFRNNSGQFFIGVGYRFI